MLSKHKLTFKSPVSQHSKPSLCKLLPFYGRKTSIYRPSPEPGRSRIKSLTHQNIVKKTPSLFGVAYRKEIKKAKIQQYTGDYGTYVFQEQKKTDQNEYMRPNKLNRLKGTGLLSSQRNIVFQSPKSAKLLESTKLISRKLSNSKINQRRPQFTKQILHLKQKQAQHQNSMTTLSRIILEKDNPTPSPNTSSGDQASHPNSTGCDSFGRKMRQFAALQRIELLSAV